MRRFQIAVSISFFFFLNDPAPPGLYPFPLHAAFPIYARDRAWLTRYSAYQNVKPGVKYPPVLFITETTDDRVTPIWARMMAAKMEAQGHDVLFYETAEDRKSTRLNSSHSQISYAVFCL